MKILKKVLRVLAEAIVALAETGLMLFGLAILWVSNKYSAIGLFVLACILVVIKLFVREDKDGKDET